MAVRNRLHRSELAVPGSNLRMLEKAPTAGADVVFLDLEDAVAPDDKAQARKNVIAALNDMDWSRSSVSVRINGLDTRYCYRDIVDVVEQAGDKLDTLLIPKVNRPADILFVSTLLEQIEAARGLEPINIHILIETALGMANVESIAQTCPERLEAMVFGVADYAASTQARTTQMGGANPDYAVLTHADAGGRREGHWGDQWHYAISRLVVACRAYGLRPIDGPFGDIQDPEGFLAVARSVAALAVKSTGVPEYTVAIPPSCQPPRIQPRGPLSCLKNGVSQMKLAAKKCVRSKSAGPLLRSRSAGVATSVSFE